MVEESYPVDSMQSTTQRLESWVRNTWAGRITALVTGVAVAIPATAGLAELRRSIQESRSQHQARELAEARGNTVTDRSELDFIPGVDIDEQILNPKGNALAWDVANGQPEGTKNMRNGYGDPRFGDPQKFGVPGGARSAISIVEEADGTITGRVVVVRPISEDGRSGTRTEVLRIAAMEDVDPSGGNRNAREEVQAKTPFLETTFVGRDGVSYRVQAYRTSPVGLLPGEHLFASFDTAVRDENGRNLTPETFMHPDQQVLGSKHGPVAEGVATIEL